MSKTLRLILILLVAVVVVALLWWLRPQPTRAIPATSSTWVAQLQLLAGDGMSGMRDGEAARFADPFGVAWRDGVLVVADAGDNNRIRRIHADGRVDTLAGGREGFADGRGSAAAFNTPSGLAYDSSGNLYVADTGNHAIRKISPAGEVTTVAGNGTPGDRDGVGRNAQFNGPVGIAVNNAGQVFVADTYNDRIRMIGRDGHVRTIAGGDRSGDADGDAIQARFDTPTGLAFDSSGVLWIADSGHNAIRRLHPDGSVDSFAAATALQPRRPLAVLPTHDGHVYASEGSGGRILQASPRGEWRVLVDASTTARLGRVSGLAMDPSGALYAADSTAMRVHRIVAAPFGIAAAPGGMGSQWYPDAGLSVPGLARASIGLSPAHPLPATAGRWPVAPQDQWHEVVGTLGEVRGNGRGESRHHLHGGLDIAGDVGQAVLAIADAKVSSVLPTFGFGGLSEGMELDQLTYIHMRVGRTARGQPLNPARFVLQQDANGKPERVRVRRGTRFQAGDGIGTINPMAHVHLVVNAAGFTRNAIALGFTGFIDTVPPQIDAIQLLDANDQPLSRTDGQVVVERNNGPLQIVVEARDQVDGNLARRRLGLYELGYQWLHADGRPLPGYEQPRITLRFDRISSDDAATRVAYAADSGITVHGAAVTRFRYVVSNEVRDGQHRVRGCDPAGLAPGNYTLRITARDWSGNEAVFNRDLAVQVR